METICWKCGMVIPYTQNDIYYAKKSIMCIHQPRIKCLNCNSQISVVNERRKDKTN